MFTLQRFATCSLLSVLLFFSLAATKLPSYWLPAVPAAALLTALAATHRDGPGGRIALAATLMVLLGLAAGLGMSAVWIPWIQDPTLPSLQRELLKAPWLQMGAALLLLSAVLAAVPTTASRVERLLQLHLPMLAFVPLVLLPLWEIGDALRGAPLRRMASIVVRETRSGEPLAMVGLMKPSLHFYAWRVVIYEGRSPVALVNLEDRLRQERRRGFQPTSLNQQPSLLLVIDRETSSLPHWQGLASMSLGASGPYQLVRMDRGQLQRRARELQASGHRISWRDSRPERY
jgi:4-amino-4-deoxy-L-arabinose transferase-like glycosyltransferase